MTSIPANPRGGGAAATPDSDAATLCWTRSDDSHPISRWLLPLGAVGALWPGTPPWAALLAGSALALIFGNPCASLTGRLSRGLLQLAVVGLGAGVNLAAAAKAGLHGLGYTLAGLLGTLLLGGWLARRFAIRAKPGLLISVGTAICGGSAIAAVAPSIDAEPRETSTALATVFLLNAVALIVFPAIGTWAGLDAEAFGLWCALAIHDTSSVTGAAATHGPVALATATTVKLARALWIIPVALAASFWFGRREETNRPRRGIRPPWFIGGFVALSAVFTARPAWHAVAHPTVTVARSLLTLTLFLIGTGLDRSSVRAAGARPFLFGLVLWVIVSLVTLAAISRGWIH